jgi:hypothetical protein
VAKLVQKRARRAIGCNDRKHAEARVDALILHGQSVDRAIACAWHHERQRVRLPVRVALQLAELR